MSSLPKVRIVLNSNGEARRILIGAVELSVCRAAVEWTAGVPCPRVDFTLTADSVETRIDPSLDDHS